MSFALLSPDLSAVTPGGIISISSLEVGMRLRSFRIEHIFLVVFTLVLVYELFIPPLVGLANSGDFPRIMASFDLRYPGNEAVDSLRLFVVRKMEWHHGLAVHYPSSSLLFVGTALLASVPLSRNGLFDIRILGVVYVCVYLFTFWLLGKYTRTLSALHRILLYALITIVFADVGYVAYFNSFFSEPASLVFLSATVSLGLIAAIQDRSGRRSMLVIAGFFLAALLFSTAKVQNTPLALVLAIIGYRLAMLFPHEEPRRRRRRKIHSLALAGALILFSVVDFAAYTVASRQIRFVNLYDSVFYEILAHSPTPEDDASELGMDPSMAQFAGSTAYAQGLPEEVKEQLLANVSSVSIVKFYLRHPGRLLDLSRRAAKSSFSRPAYLGNYERSYVLRIGRKPVSNDLLVLPNEYQSRKFALWSLFKQSYLPKSLWFILTFMLMNLACIVAKRARVDRTPEDRAVTELHAGLVLMAMLQFLTVIVGEGEYEIVKHLFLFNLLCEVCFVFLVMYGVSAVTALLKPRAKAEAA
jgi:hypothetical protein